MRKLIAIVALLTVSGLAEAQMGFAPAGASARRRPTAVFLNPVSYWTDTNTYAGFLLEMGHTNSIGMYLDTSGQNNHFTNYPSYASGPSYTIVGTNALGDVEYATTYDGNDDSLRSYDNLIILDEATNLTVGCWVKRTGTMAAGNFDGILCTREELSIWTRFVGLGMGTTSNSVRLTVQDISGASGTSFAHYTNELPLNEWVFLTGRWRADTGDADLFVNGVLVTSTADTSTATSPILVYGPWNTAYDDNGSRFAPIVIDHAFADPTYWSSNSIFDLAQNTPPTNNLRNKSIAAVTNTPAVTNWVDPKNYTNGFYFEMQQTNASGYLVDSSSNGRELEILGGATEIQAGLNFNGRAEVAYFVDGANDRFTTTETNILNGATQFTAGVWIKQFSDTQTAYDGLLWQAGTRNIGLDYDATGTKIRAIVVDSGGNVSNFTPTDAFPIGLWTHVAIRWQASTGEIDYYQNGVLVTNAATDTSAATSSLLVDAKWAVASDETGGRYFYGQVYSSFLTSELWSEADIYTNCTYTTPKANYRER